MRIISKDRDYYDTASGGWHSDVLWKRERRDRVILKQRTFSFSPFSCSLEDDESYFIVGFCGTIYYGIKTVKPILDRYGYTGADEISYRYLEPFNLKRDVKQYFKVESPIFAIYKNKYNEYLEINPSLKEYMFYKVKDAFTAHQELEQYLTNEMAIQEDGTDLVETENQILQRHGMDRCSFKGKHTGRKLKRKKKKWIGQKNTNKN